MEVYDINWNAKTWKAIYYMLNYESIVFGSVIDWINVTMGSNYFYHFPPLNDKKL